MHADPAPALAPAHRLRRADLRAVPAAVPPPAEDLRARWAALRRREPAVQNREAALALGVSEAELVASGIGHSVTRLRSNWGALLSELESLGPVVAITRNERCVHEKYGVYGNVRVLGPTGIVLNEAIDLRLYFDHWQHGFAASEGSRHTLEFYDRHGTAVHRLILEPTSSRRAYQDIVSRYASADQEPGVTVTPRTAPEPETPDAEIDPIAFRGAWGRLEDTHDFVQLLRTFRVGRLQALRLAGPDFATRVHRASALPVLKSVAGDCTPILVFVGNPGTVQIHTGPVGRISTTPHWLNVRDPSFHLRLRTDRIAEAWVVRKPTVDGTISALELYDAAGDLVAQFFAARKPGHPEPSRWRTLLGRLGTIAR